MENTEQYSQLYDIRGKTYLITGGAGVLGSEMACALVERGANVSVFERNPELASILIQCIPRETGFGKAIAIVGDALQPDTISQAVQETIATFGAIDGLINCAGGNKVEATTSDVLKFFDLSQDAIRSVIDLNLLGTILPSQIIGRHMAERKQGVILNISSMNAFRPLTRIPAYSAAKAGVSNFTQWLATHMAQEYSPNIRVNALAPGFFLTEQNHFLLVNPEGNTLTERGKQIIDHTPMARFGSPHDLIGPMLWLLSSASAFVTGIVLPVDGGFSAFSGV